MQNESRNPLAVRGAFRYLGGVFHAARLNYLGILSALFTGLLGPWTAFAQIDPFPREMIQLGYNASFQGQSPIAAYAFYYRNAPDFLHNTNLTLRLAIAPVFLDSELGISRAFGPNTDLGIGLAGGGFADSYDEIRGGKYLRNESFNGDGGEASVSLYHCFNPGQLIPLNGMLRGIVHYSTYGRNDTTASNFRLPDDRETFSVRSGLRWGGKEPLLYPSLAMELSVWYESHFRTGTGDYGLPGHQAMVEKISHLFWMQALLAYTMTNSGQNFLVSLSAGTSVDADRFSAYRLGALLPLVSEFPLSLPGYYFNEISARNFVLFGANYIVPLSPKHRWNINFTASTAAVDYLAGLEQPGNWHSGVGAGLLYQSRSLKCMLGYAYGVDAIRDGGHGAHSIGVLMQFDLGHARQSLLNPGEPGRWRGFQKILGAIND